MIPFLLKCACMPRYKF